MSSSTGKLWDKGLPLNELMHKLTVGNDYVLDLTLLEWDCVGSAAHARMLEKIGLLSGEECEKLCAVLAAIRERSRAGNFPIAAKQEDAHTAIEAALTEELGDIGKKIHAGRSRNDQVVLCMRLFERHCVLLHLSSIMQTIDCLHARYDQCADIPMPGYTHMQPAMPSSVGMWLHAFIEAALDVAREGFDVLAMLDENPLGSAAGFGSGLPLDRAYVAELLGFSRVQRSFIDVQNSRTRKGDRYLHWMTQIAGVFEKFAWDMLLYSSREFGFFSMPPEMTTGSSIMPQKRNLDLCELLRAKCSRIRGIYLEFMQVAAKLPSSYHRDLQYTKEPCMRATNETAELLQMAELLIGAFALNEERLREAVYPDLYATYVAYQRVLLGKPFRDAYRETAQDVLEGRIEPEDLEQFYRRVLDDTAKAVDESRRETEELKEKLSLLKAFVEEHEEGVFLG